MYHTTPHICKELRSLERLYMQIPIAPLGWAFINGSDDASNTPSEPFYEAARGAGAEVRVHDPWVDPATSPDLPNPDQPDRGLTMDLEQALSGTDYVVILTGHAVYWRLEPEDLKLLCGCWRPGVRGWEKCCDTGGMGESRVCV